MESRPVAPQRAADVLRGALDQVEGAHIMDLLRFFQVSAGILFAEDCSARLCSDFLVAPRLLLRIWEISTKSKQGCDTADQK